jgi:hypothetical protein
MVPGAWHTASIYSSISSILNTHGYPTICLDLPSAGTIPPHPSVDHDVSTIRECLTSLVSSTKDVVLVAWSYGGFPSGEAPKGLSKKERITQGLKGGVIRFVVINGVAMPAGYQPHAPGDYGSMPEWIEKDIPVVSPPPPPPLFPSLPVSCQCPALIVMHRTTSAPSPLQQQNRSFTTTSPPPKQKNYQLSSCTKVSGSSSAPRHMQHSRISRQHSSVAAMTGRRLAAE